MNITFTFLRSKTSPESLSKMELWAPKHHTKGVDQRKLRRADILAFFYLSVYVYTNLLQSNNLQVTGLNYSTEYQTFSELCATKVAL